MDIVIEIGIGLLVGLVMGALGGGGAIITVPALVDVPTGQVVTNDFHQMVKDLVTEWGEHHREDAPDLWPEALRDEIDPTIAAISSILILASLILVVIAGRNKQ